MKTVLITKTGYYSIPEKPFLPNVLLIKGSTHDLQNSLADLVLSCNCGEIIEDTIQDNSSDSGIPEEEELETPEESIPEVETKESPTSVKSKSSKRKNKRG